MFTSSRLHACSFLLIFCLIGAGVLLGGCPPSGPCDAGVSVLVLDDSRMVTNSVRNSLYASGQILGTDDADYPSAPRMAVIRYETEDYPWNPEVTEQVIQQEVFGSGSQSIRGFFFENSYGQFNLQNGGVSQVVSLDANTTDFGDGTIGDPQVGNDWTRNPELARQLCERSGLDWSAIDTNHDHVIASREVQICFLGALGGGGACRPNTVNIVFNDETYVIPQRFVFFDCLPENDTREATQGNIRYNHSTIMHELAHGLFCLPDRYRDFCGSGYTGQFDLMSNNCAGTFHFNIHDKMKIGWVRPKILNSVGTYGRPPTQCYSFPASETTPAGLILINTRTTVNEYWMVENRYSLASSQNWDRGLPESGMCIWHVRVVPGGHDEVRLVDASRPGLDPLLYQDQTIGALYKQRPGVTMPTQTLRYAGGAASPILFGKISREGFVMFGEF